MKVLYDHQIFSRQKHGGISRYFAELMREYDKSGEVEYELSLYYSDNQYLQKTVARGMGDASSTISPRSVLRNIAIVRRMYDAAKSAFNTRASLSALRKSSFDIFHPTYYDPYFLPHIGNTPFVVTVHDMIHELYPNYFSTTDMTRKHKSLLVQRASHIITVSENTKNDLCSLLSVPEEKVTVVYHASALDTKMLTPVVTPDRYMLFVGGRTNYKNFAAFIRAVAPFMIQHGIHAFCAGGDAFRDTEHALFAELGISHMVIQKHVQDSELVYLYTYAFCFVFPSLYEGFGIPILEAFSCGCPVLASNKSALPEVAGDAAHYFDPFNDDSIRTAVEDMLSSTLRAGLVERGYARNSLFSWKRAAAETAAVYKMTL